MATNLTRGERGFTWAIDPDALESLLRDFFADDEWAVVERPPGRMSLHFVKADASSTLSEPACTRLEQLARVTSRVHLHRIAGGHWVNTENPEAMVELLAARLPQEWESRKEEGGRKS
jgi:surfactin synthase thioesterase subunit